MKNNIEIEKKYLINFLPENLTSYRHSEIIQSYLCDSPVLRIRKIDNDYLFTYKGKGLLSRKEINIPISESEFVSLYSKSQNKIEKTRYFIEYNSFTIELDIFKGNLSGLIIAEVEFENIAEAENFIPPKWFGEDITNNPKYQNVNLIKED